MEQILLAGYILRKNLDSGILPQINLSLECFEGFTVNLFEHCRDKKLNSQRVSLHSPLPLRTDTLIGR